jgi:hypothetical protein
LNPAGRLGFICPHKFFNAKYGAPLRSIIADGQHLSHVVHFGDQQVFEKATTYTCLLFLDKSPAKACRFVKVNDLSAWRSSGTGTEGTIKAAQVTASEWDFAVGDGAALFDRLNKMPVKLRHVARKVFQGLVTSADPIYLLRATSAASEGLVRAICDADGKEYVLETQVAKPLCKGSVDIHRYFAAPSRRVVFPYDPELSEKTGRCVLIPERPFARNYPKAWRYLLRHADALRKREKGKMQHEGWYGYVYPKNVSLFAQPKILTPSIAARSSFTLDPTGEVYFVGSGGGGGGGYGIILYRHCTLAYQYVLGLLNSRLLDWAIKSLTSRFRGGYYAFSRQFIERLPIRVIDFSNKADNKAHDRMVSLVDSMLALHKQLASVKSESQKTVIQHQIDATDAEIDRLVYDLYGLTAEEIAIVEGSRGNY